MKPLCYSSLFALLLHADPCVAQRTHKTIDVAATAEPSSRSSVPDAILRFEHPGLYVVDDNGAAMRLEKNVACAVETEPGLSFKQRTVLRFNTQESTTRLTAAPVLYLRLDTASTLVSLTEILLVRLFANNGHREVETRTRNCYQQREGVALDRRVPLRVDRIADRLYHLNVDRLCEGEYALLLPGADTLGLGTHRAFDFGIGQPCDEKATLSD